MKKKDLEILVDLQEEYIADSNRYIAAKDSHIEFLEELSDIRFKEVIKLISERDRAIYDKENVEDDKFDAQDTNTNLLAILAISVYVNIVLGVLCAL